MSAPKEFAQGIDISHWDRRYDPYKKPVDFVIIKASEGLSRDPAFNQLLQDAAPVPVKGAYHYYRSGVDWKRQADNFLAAIGGLGLHFLALDYEKINNVLSQATDNDARKMLDYLSSKSGLTTLLYATHSMLKNEMALRGSTWVLSYPLWVARWFGRSYYLSTATEPGLPYLIWQYGGDDPLPVMGYKQGLEYGVQADSIDLDVYDGNLAKMRADLKIPPLPEPGPIEPAPLTVEQRLDRIEAWIKKAGGFFD